VGVIPQIKKTDGLKEIKIGFSSKPSSYSVQCWKYSDIKRLDAYEKYCEVVDISDNTFTDPVDNNGYIYEVHAIWSKGDVYYSFYLESSN